MLTWKCCSHYFKFHSLTYCSHSEINYKLVPKGVHLSQTTNPYAYKVKVKYKLISELPRYPSIRVT